jgi:hypothetical protein
MSGISPQQKEGYLKRRRKRKRSKNWKAKEVNPHLKSSIFQKEKRNKGWDLETSRRDSIEIK